MGAIIAFVVVGAILFLVGFFCGCFYAVIFHN